MRLIRVYLLGSVVLGVGFGHASSPADKEMPFSESGKVAYETLRKVMAGFPDKIKRCSSAKYEPFLKSYEIAFPKGKRDQFFYRNGNILGYFKKIDGQYTETWEISLEEKSGPSGAVSLPLKTAKNNGYLRWTNLKFYNVVSSCGKPPVAAQFYEVYSVSVPMGAVKYLVTSQGYQKTLGSVPEFNAQTTE